MWHRDFSQTLELFKEMLPPGLEFYEIGDGQILFPIYGDSGGIRAEYAAWLVERGVGRPTFTSVDLGLSEEVVDHGCGWKTVCVRSSPGWRDRLHNAVHALRPGYVGNIFKPRSLYGAWLKCAPKIIRRKVAAFLAA